MVGGDGAGSEAEANLGRSWQFCSNLFWDKAIIHDQGLEIVPDPES